MWPSGSKSLTPTLATSWASTTPIQTIEFGQCLNRRTGNVGFRISGDGLRNNDDEIFTTNVPLTPLDTWLLIECYFNQGVSGLAIKR